MNFLPRCSASRRSGVTVAAATLQGAGYIRYAHGHVTISDRAPLEATACECYKVAQAQFNSLLRDVASAAGGQHSNVASVRSTAPRPFPRGFHVETAV